MKTYPNLCMACNKQHIWGLVHPKYFNVCGDCIETDPRVHWNAEQEEYALFAYCNCGAHGPVNYGRHDTDYLYYCGGSLSMCRP